MLGEGFDADDALELLGRHDGDARVLVVGHDPSFAQVVHDLTGGRSTSRRARSPRSASTRPSGRADRAAAPARARVARRSPAERGLRDARARPPRAWPSDSSTMYSLGVVRRAAARAEPVDRHRDRGGEVAGVARAAAVHRRDGPAERGRRRARAAARSRRVESIPGHSAHHLRVQRRAADLVGDRGDHARRRRRRRRRACRRPARRRRARR